MIALACLFAAFSSVLPLSARPTLDRSGAPMPFVLGTDTLHLVGTKVKGPCERLRYEVREAKEPGTSARFSPMPGEQTFDSLPVLADITWSSLDALGLPTCGDSLARSPGSLRFRYRGSQDRAIQLDPVDVFTWLNDSSSTKSFVEVTQVRLNFQGNVYDSLRPVIHWQDSVEQYRMPTRWFASLVDSARIDSITLLSHRLARDDLQITIAPPGKTPLKFRYRDSASIHYPKICKYLNAPAPIDAFPPGTRFRLEDLATVLGGQPTIRTIAFWSGGKILDSLRIVPTFHMGVRRRTASGASIPARGVYDLAGTRIPPTPASAPRCGGQVVEDRGHTSILFGK